MSDKPLRCTLELVLRLVLRLERVSQNGRKVLRLHGKQGVITALGSISEALKPHPDGTEIVLKVSGVPWDGAWSKHVGTMEILAVHDPGGVCAALQRHFEAGALQEAWALLKAQHARYFESDPKLRAWRIKIAQELEHQGAAEDLRALLTMSEMPPAGEAPPGLLNLYRGFSLEERAALTEDLRAFLTNGRTSYESWDTRQLFDLIPIERWPLGYLTHRLREGGQRAELQRWRAEASRREPSLKPQEQEKLQKALKALARKERAQAQSAAPPRSNHRLLGRALRGCPQAFRPPPPHHMGGPPPEVHSEALKQLLVWIALWAKPLVRVRQAEYASVLTRIANGESRSERTISDDQDSEMSIAYRALAPPVRLRLMTRSVGRQIDAALRLCEIRDPPRAGAFVRWLDDALMLAEYQGCLRKCRPSAPAQAFWPNARVVLRRFDLRGRPEAHIARLEQGYALVHTVQGSVRVQLGDPEEILASVPDDWFDEAIAAMM